MKNNFRFLCLFLFGSCCMVLAQTPDSLFAVLRKSKPAAYSAIEIEISKYYLTTAVDSSLYYAKKALVSAQKVQNDTAIAKAYRWLGEWYQSKTRYSESVSAYWSAIKLAQKLKDKSLESSLFNGLGITYYLQQDLKKAEEYIQKAAELRYEIKDYTYYSVILTNLSAIYFHHKAYDKAIGLLRKTEKSLLKQPEGAYMASLYNTLGGCYQMAYPEKDSAVYYYTKSIEVAKRFGIDQNIMTGYHNLGEDALRKKQYDVALAYLKKALEMSSSLGNDTYVMNVHATLAETYRGKGDFKNAFQHQQEELALSKKIFESDKQKTIKEMEFKYETAIKDQKLLEQEEVIQASLLQAEKDKNTRNSILFVFLFVLLVFAFGWIYYYQKRKAKAKLEAEKAKIFENIVHDIRTPLTLIKGPLEVIKKEHLDAPTAQAFRTIEVQSEQLISLVSELLDASKLEKGKYVPTMKVGNPILEIEKRVESLKDSLAAKQIEFTFAFSGGMENCYFPADVVDKVMNNLLSNAVKFTPEKGEINVKANLSETVLNVTVFNSGGKIPTVEQPRIFERFYRLPQHQAISGSGIGLSLSKELLEVVNGSIFVENQEDGVAFVFSLPVSLARSAMSLSTDEEKPLLLLVEDNSAIRDFMMDYLSADFQLLVAENGELGYALAQEQLPDLVLTDILMPGMSGIELLVQLKANPLTSHLPVVICSSKQSENSRIEGLSKGASAYVSKPFHPEELRLTLLSLFEQEKLTRKKGVEQRQTELPCRERLRSSHDFVNKASALVFEQLENVDYDVNDLADSLHLSRSQLHRKLTQLTGLSASQFIKMIRLEQAKDYLRSGSYNVTEVAYRCGFNTQSYFSTSFQDYTGQSPSSFVNGGKKVT